MLFPTLVVFALGASIGSFLNVVIYRVPAGLSILYPPSRCPQCLHQLGKGENIPVFGWIWLKGRCKHCKTKIPARYPSVEALTGILFLLVFLQFGVSWQTLGYWVFLSWLLSLSLIDWDTMTLPNSLTKSGLIVGLVFIALWGWQSSSSIAGVSQQLMTGIASAVLGIWLFDLISFLGSLAFGQAAMGGGDAKLAAMIGAWLGWKLMLLSSFIACFLGAFFGGGAMALRILNRRQPIPFGPFLALGATITLFWGERILTAYLRLFFPFS